MGSSSIRFATSPATDQERTVTISLDELRSWLAHASYHLRLAVAIAALAPKLRLANVLSLTWHENIDAEMRFITVHRHETDAALRRPQVVPISDQLRVILRDARQRTHTHVVEYRKRPVRTIRAGLRLTVERAGLPFGRAANGATFHTFTAHRGIPPGGNHGTGVSSRTESAVNVRLRCVR